MRMYGVKVGSRSISKFQKFTIIIIVINFFVIKNINVISNVIHLYDFIIVFIIYITHSIKEVDQCKDALRPY